LSHMCFAILGPHLEFIRFEGQKAWEYHGYP
jgi:hypothetical protein